MTILFGLVRIHFRCLVASIALASCFFLEADGVAASPAQLREFSPIQSDQWIGQGISYGPYREGQAPGGAQPTSAQIIEDLTIVSQHWNLLRIYGADEVAERILQVIRDNKLPIKVMLGVWITRETFEDPLEEAAAKAGKESNRSHVKTAIALANKFKDEVIAVSVGNETQVYWSDHIVQADILIDYIKQVRQNVSQPVTTADDFNFWNKPESKAVADEVDFIVLHAHAHWAGTQPEKAMEWTEDIYAHIAEHHPGKLIVIGEAGWATQVHNEGEQAKLIKGEASEETQKMYYDDFTAWAAKQKICTFFFEAFDEPWKGGPHPNEVEKHWGLFNVDRSPKAAMK